MLVCLSVCLSVICIGVFLCLVYFVVKKHTQVRPETADPEEIKGCNCTTENRPNGRGIKCVM